MLVSNPLEWAMRNVLGGLILGIVGFNPIAIVIAGGLNIYGDFSHCGGDLKGGWLNYVFNTPEVHRWHHSTEFPDDPEIPLWLQLRRGRELLGHSVRDILSAQG